MSFVFVGGFFVSLKAREKLSFLLMLCKVIITVRTVALVDLV